MHGMRTRAISVKTLTKVFIMNNFLHFFKLSPLIFLLVFTSCRTNPEDSLVIACAANMKAPLDSLAIIFEQETGIPCEITSGSSGMLTTQIMNGAPYDIFISADVNYPTSIYENGNGKKPFVYATGRLVLAVDKRSNYQSLEEALLDPELKRIGIADKRFAPYGSATEEVLVNAGIKEAIKGRVVIGESIGQINQYLTTGAVDAGFTNYSFKVENEDKFDFFEVNPTLFSPIVQAAIVLNSKKKKNLGTKFKAFLSSENGKEILTYFGYLVE